MPPPSAAFTPEIDRQKLQGICQQLAEQLAADDFAGVQSFEENRQLLQAGLGNDFIALDKAIQKFNFSHALELMRVSAKNAGLVLKT